MDDRLDVSEHGLPPLPKKNRNPDPSPHQDLPPLSTQGKKRPAFRLQSSGVTILIIGVIGFVIGVLLALGLLSGVIEIRPSAIKGFFKTIMGK